MTALRALVRRHCVLTLALVLTALAMKALVPGGFMVRAEGRTVTIAVCDGHGDRTAVMLAVPGQPAGKTADKGAPVCAFTALAFGVLGAADAALLAALLLFIVAVALRPVAAPPARRSAHLRPPLRGPPIAA